MQGYKGHPYNEIKGPLTEYHLKRLSLNFFHHPCSNVFQLKLQALGEFQEHALNSWMKPEAQQLERVLGRSVLSKIVFAIFLQLQDPPEIVNDKSQVTNNIDKNIADLQVISVRTNQLTIRTLGYTRITNHKVKTCELQHKHKS